MAESKTGGDKVATTAMVRVDCAMMTPAEIKTRTNKKKNCWPGPQSDSVFSISRYQPVFVIDEADGSGVVCRTVVNRGARNAIGVVGVLNFWPKTANVKFIGISTDDQSATDMGARCKMLSVAISGAFTITYRPAYGVKNHDVMKKLLFRQPKEKDGASLQQLDALGVFAEMYCEDDNKQLDYATIGAEVKAIGAEVRKGGTEPDWYTESVTAAGANTGTDQTPYFWRIVAPFVFAGDINKAFQALMILTSNSSEASAGIALFKVGELINAHSKRSDTNRSLYITKMGVRNGPVDVVVL